MSVFKKQIIGQDLSEPTRPAYPTPEAYPAPSAASAVTASPAAPSVSTGISSAAGSRSVINVLSSDVEIKGTVKFSNDLVVDGKIEGEINSDGKLTVGENARIRAEIKTGTVIVYGKVHGNISALDRVELKSSAEVVGDIKAKTLSIEAGAIFVGKSTVGTPAQSSPSQGPTLAKTGDLPKVAGVNP